MCSIYVRMLPIVSVILVSVIVPLFVLSMSTALPDSLFWTDSCRNHGEGGEVGVGAGLLQPPAGGQCLHPGGGVRLLQQEAADPSVGLGVPVGRSSQRPLLRNPTCPDSIWCITRLEWLPIVKSQTKWMAMCLGIARICFSVPNLVATAVATSHNLWGGGVCIITPFSATGDRLECWPGKAPPYCPHTYTHMYTHTPTRAWQGFRTSSKVHTLSSTFGFGFYLINFIGASVNALPTKKDFPQCK